LENGDAPHDIATDADTVPVPSYDQTSAPVAPTLSR
jgi:hypothetical protein